MLCKILYVAAVMHQSLGSPLGELGHRGFPFFLPLNAILVDLAHPRPSGASVGEFFFPGAGTSLYGVPA